MSEARAAWRNPAQSAGFVSATVAWLCLLSVCLLTASAIACHGSAPDADETTLVPPTDIACYYDEAGLTKPGGSIQVNGFTITTEPDQGSGKRYCRATVTTPQGVPIYQHLDVGISLKQAVSGKDINGAGSPDVVLVGYTGALRCCWTFAFVSLGPRPGLIRQFTNRADASFEDLKGDGHIEILTGDGGYDFYSDRPGALNPSPSLVLQLNGDKFTDMGAAFADTYDHEIERVRARLDPASLHDFLHLDPGQLSLDLSTNEATKTGILTIALDYLYSGRADQAWKTLDEMWPAYDRTRIRNKILTIYCGGVRKDLGLAMIPACSSYTPTS